MTTPLLDPSDTNLAWQNEDQRKKQLYDQQQNLDKITPDASSLTTDPYYQRLQTIRDDSANQLTGSLNIQKSIDSRNQALQAAEFARQHQASLDAATSAYGNLASGIGMDYGAAGSDPSAGWGSGGAQGVANVLRQAGFPESAVPTMMAIAMAESSWNPAAVNDKNRNGSIDRGLFQINSVHQGNSWYPTNPFDPLQSAKAAYAIWQGAGQTFRDWTVYTSGAYKKFIPSSVPPVYAANTGGSTGLRLAQGSQAQSFSGVPTTTARAQALSISRQVLNIPYVWGGNSLKSGVDCSGLVQQVYAQMGINMPRQAREQATTGVRVQSYNQLQPGDLVAFKWAGGYAGPNIVSHISIYIGNGQIIEAAGGSHGDIRSLGNSAQDQGAIYIHTRFPGE